MNSSNTFSFLKKIFFIRLDNKDYVLKITNPKRPKATKNEIAVYKFLNETPHKYFNTPKMVYHESNFYIMTKINKPKEDAFFNHPHAVKEFNFSTVKNNVNLNRQTFLENISFRFTILLFLSFKKISLKTFIRSFKILFSAFLIPNFRSRFLIHKDLKPKKNHIILNETNLIFYDFELTKTTKKFFLLDVVDLSIDLNGFKINYNLLNKYLSLIQEFDLNKKFIERQIRFLILRWHLLQLRNNQFYPKDILTSLNTYFQNDFYLDFLQIGYQKHHKD